MRSVTVTTHEYTAEEEEIRALEEKWLHDRDARIADDAKWREEMRQVIYERDARWQADVLAVLRTIAEQLAARS